MTDDRLLDRLTDWAVAAEEGRDPGADDLGDPSLTSKLAVLRYFQRLTGGPAASTGEFPAGPDTTPGVPIIPRTVVQPERVVPRPPAPPPAPPVPVVSQILGPAYRDLKPGDDFAGFRITAELGRGGMGVVFRAWDLNLRRDVALKVMNAETAGSQVTRNRFVKEARSMAALHHDHVVPVYTAEIEHGLPYLVMPLLAGEPLDARLQRDRGLPLAEVLRIGREIADGLAAAHAAGIVHRDLKPGNIWLEAPRDRVKLLDFGLARETGGSGDMDHSSSGLLVGTPAYMSPEQARSLDLDQRSDLFSFGSVLYEMAAGRRPFSDPSVWELLRAVCETDPPPAKAVDPAIPAELSDLIARLHRKNPAERPASAREVEAALRRMHSAGSSEVPFAVAAADGGEPWEAFRDPGYEIVRELDRDAASIRYQVKNRATQSLEVVRDFRPKAAEPVASLPKAVATATAVRHRNVVKYLASLPGRAAYTAEYVNGADLRRIVLERGSIPAARACNYVAQAALGLKAVHDVGLVHGAIHPTHLIRTRVENKHLIQVRDFGLPVALLRAARGGVGSAVGAGEVDGFLAPELLTGRKEADARSDVFGLGCALYFLITGRVPFPDRRAAAAGGPPPVPPRLDVPEIPLDLRDILRRMISERPEDRYPRVIDAYVALATFLKAHGDGEGGTGEQIPVVGPPEPVVAPAASPPVGVLVRDDKRKPPAWVTEGPQNRDVGSGRPRAATDRPARSGRQPVPPEKRTGRKPLRWLFVLVCVLVFALVEVACLLLWQYETGISAIEEYRPSKTANLQLLGYHAFFHWAWLPGAGATAFTAWTMRRKPPSEVRLFFGHVVRSLAYAVLIGVLPIMAVAGTYHYKAVLALEAGVFVVPVAAAAWYLLAGTPFAMFGGFIAIARDRASQPPASRAP
jgi:serine/threonine protein kinase